MVYSDKVSRDYVKYINDFGGKSRLAHHRSPDLDSQSIPQLKFIKGLPKAFARTCTPGGYPSDNDRGEWPFPPRRTRETMEHSHQSRESQVFATLLAVFNCLLEVKEGWDTWDGLSRHSWTQVEQDFLAFHCLRCPQAMAFKAIS